MPLPPTGKKEQESYAKWKTIVTEHNTQYGGYRFDLDTEWKKAPDMGAFIRAFKARQEKALTPRVASTKEEGGPTSPPTQTLSATMATSAEASELPVAIPTVTPSTPSTVPITPPKKKKPTVTKPKDVSKFIGISGYTPTPEPSVDPYAGLSLRAKVHAQHLKTSGLGGGFSGTSDLTLTQADVNQLRDWVESQITTGGKQKWVVNVGEGTGTYTGKNQFKVTGFGTVAGSTKAPTYHITIKDGLT